MGKSTKRRGRKKGGSKTGGSNISSNNSNNSSSSGSSPLINKIRHANSVVRHGALSALSSTLFCPESLSTSKQSGTTIKMELIRAVAERIMDEDMPCALCAVGCIANYILFVNHSGTTSSANGQNQDQNHVNKVETILTPVLLAKMNKACDQIETIHKEMVHFASSLSSHEGDSNNDSSVTAQSNQNEGNNKKKNKKSSQNKKKSNTAPSVKMDQMGRMIMEQFTLISLSLHAFCGMVENYSVNNSSSSLLHHERSQFLSTTMRTLIISKEMIQSLSDATCVNTIIADEDKKAKKITESTGNDNAGDDPVTTVNKLLAKKENDENVISDVATYAARTMHSSSDDNPEFVEALMMMGLSTSTSTAINAWDVIVSTISNATLPALSRLHCAGTVITSRQCILDIWSSSSSNSNAKLQKIQNDIDTIIANQAFPLLLQSTIYSTDIASALCQQITAAECKLKEERQDEDIEKNVIQMVDKRKESARLIARRQKKMKKEAADAAAEKEKLDKIDETMNDEGIDEKGSTDNDENGDCEMKNDHDNESNEETEDKYDKAINAWKNACMPLKLSVEVIANLCARRTGEDENEDFDDMDGWDLEKEGQLLSSCATTPDFTTKLEEDEEFLNGIISSGIPDRVLSVFGCILLSLIGVKKDQIPGVAMEDLLDIVTKCGICLGNAVCNLEQWKSNEADLTAVWKDFFQCLTTAMDGEVAFANTVLPCQAISSLFTTMVAFLRFRPSLVKSVNEQDLELILSYVLLECPLEARKTGPNAEVKYSDVVSDIQKDAIGLLGILCSEPHPDQINERICSVFLTVLNRSHSSSAALISELMNALMDMYSADEGDPNNHESVFRNNNVLGAFQKNVPILRRKIREETDNTDPMDVALWKETALNASRFIKYKQG